VAAQWGVGESIDPADRAGRTALCNNPGGADLAFELSGNAAALDLAVEAMGFDGRIVVGSWYGSTRVPLDLGSRFHRNRLRLVASQGSTIAPLLRGRWDKPRLLDFAWRLLASLPCERLPRREYALEHCQQAFEALCERPEELMQAVFRY
jgi:threonine dehydrogenase-like Zn-dependent dehydrogenase